jgi:hypothetical protein
MREVSTWERPAAASPHPPLYRRYAARVMLLSICCTVVISAL